MITVCRLLDRITKIDPKAADGFKGSSAEGAVELDKVNFTYPARVEQQVCNNMSLNVPRGMYIAKPSCKASVVRGACFIASNCV